MALPLQGPVRSPRSTENRVRHSFVDQFGECGGLLSHLVVSPELRIPFDGPYIHLASGLRTKHLKCLDEPTPAGDDEVMIIEVDQDGVIHGNPKRVVVDGLDRHVGADD